MAVARALVSTGIGVERGFERQFPSEESKVASKLPCPTTEFAMFARLSEVAPDFIVRCEGGENALSLSRLET